MYPSLLLVLLLSPTQLVEAPGVNLVRGHCTGCHSEHLITQNSGSREDWLRTIRWMQQTQNLWQIPPDAEESILNYLAKHYPARTVYRRAPLPQALRPSIKPDRIQVIQAARASKTALNPTKASGCSCAVNGHTQGSMELIFTLWITLAWRRRSRRGLMQDTRGY